MRFDNYQLAREHAQMLADNSQRPYGLEASREYGKAGFTLHAVPTDPAKRFGFELRLEPATRRVPKVFKTLKERIIPKAEAIADAFIAGNLEAVREMVGAIPVPEVSL